MADKELRRMNRTELIEIIYALEQNEQKLQEENDKLAAELDDRKIRLDQSGSIAEAALSLGAVLLVAALSLFAYNRWDDWRAGNAMMDVQDQLVELEQNKSNINHSAEMATINIDGWDYIGTLSVPRFGLELPIMSEWSYEGMKIAPGRYSGSVWTNDMVICGHNYSLHFGPLLSADAGDTIIFTDVEGNVFSYVISETEILQPTAIEEMTVPDGWDMTLFTCTLGGQTRMTIRCTLVSSDVKA